MGPVPERPGADCRVLVVDDEPQNRRLLAAHLTALGFVVDVAEDGARALEKLRAQVPDVVVSDVLMPAVDGFELCMAIRRWPERAELPVVLLSSNYDEEADAEMARKAGATSFLVRGPSMDAVTDSVIACLRVQAPAPPVATDAERERNRRASRQLERQTQRAAAATRENEILASRLASLCSLAESGGRVTGDGPVGELLHNFCADAGLPGAALWLARGGGELRLVAANALDPDAVPREAIDAAWQTGVTTGGSLTIVSVECRGDRIGVLALLEGAHAPADEALARAVAAQLGHSIGLTRAFERVARAEGRWASLMENANDAIAIIDGRGHYVEVNRRWEELTGVSRAESTGHHVVEFLPKERQAERRAYIESVLAAGKVARLGDEWYRADGALRTVDFTTSVVELGGERFALAIARDVTDRVRLESELRRAQKMEAIESLAARVAHDFNNLLSVILTYAELLAEGAVDSSTQKMLAELKAAAGKGATLTRQLLAIGREERTPLHFVDLNALLHGCAPVLRRLAGTGVEIRMELADVRVTCQADEAEIEQVLLNLVANARDAMGGEGVVTLGTEVLAGRVMLRVSDTGEGMDAATAERNRSA